MGKRMNQPLKDWTATRQTLLSRLRDWDDRESWEDFFETYGQLIYSVARKSGLQDAEAQDVVQETVITVAKRMPAFRYDPAKGSFKGWLLKTTQWRIVDHFRRRRRVHQSLPADGEVEGTYELGSRPEPDGEWDRLWDENLAAVAVARVKQRVDPREFQLFSLVVEHGLTPLEAAGKLGVTRAHVYYAKHKVARLIRKEVALLESPARRLP